MKPWVTLDTQKAPGGGVLTLQSRDGQFVIRVDGRELMSSRTHGSEEAMAARALARLPTTTPKVLLGGLGLGFTLRAALQLLPKGAAVRVVELSSAVVRWNRGALAELSGRALEDPRVTVDALDIRTVLKTPGLSYDAILMDVDNGPAALSAPGNSWLYQAGGLGACFASLHPGGTLVTWSAAEDADFLKRLGQAGFTATSERVKQGPHSSAWHTLFVGRRPRK